MNCYASRVRSVAFLLLGCAIFALGCYMLTSNDMKTKFFGFLLLASGLMFSIAMGRQLFRAGPTVIFNDEGIFDDRNGIGFILWSDVEYLSVFSRRGTTTLNVYLNDQNLYLARLPIWKRYLTTFGLRFGLPFTVIPFTGLLPEAKEVIGYLQGHHRSRIVGFTSSNA